MAVTLQQPPQHHHTPAAAAVNARPAAAVVTAADHASIALCWVTYKHLSSYAFGQPVLLTLTSELAYMLSSRKTSAVLRLLPILLLLLLLLLPGPLQPLLHPGHDAVSGADALLAHEHLVVAALHLDQLQLLGGHTARELLYGLQEMQQAMQFVINLISVRTTNLLRAHLSMQHFHVRGGDGRPFCGQGRAQRSRETMLLQHAGSRTHVQAGDCVLGAVHRIQRQADLAAVLRQMLHGLQHAEGASCKRVKRCNTLMCSVRQTQTFLHESKPQQEHRSASCTCTVACRKDHVAAAPAWLTAMPSTCYAMLLCIVPSRTRSSSLPVATRRSPWKMSGSSLKAAT